MKKYELEYMVTSIVVNKADEIAQVLCSRFIKKAMTVGSWYNGT